MNIVCSRIRDFHYVILYFQSYIVEIERARVPTLNEYDLTTHLRTNYGSDQSISNNNDNNSQPDTPLQNRR